MKSRKDELERDADAGFVELVRIAEKNRREADTAYVAARSAYCRKWPATHSEIKQEEHALLICVRACWEATEAQVLLEGMRAIP